jgi:hypothetical protein
MRRLVKHYKITVVKFFERSMTELVTTFEEIIISIFRK